MTLEVYRIPFSNEPQQFEITLNGFELIVIYRWNTEAECWMLDLTDAVTNASLIAGLPLVSGIDVLAQHEHLGLGGSLIIYTDGDETAIPTLTSLGDESNVYFVVDK